MMVDQETSLFNMDLRYGKVVVLVGVGFEYKG